MREIVTALTAQHEELDTVLRELDDDAWLRPSCCPGWTVADVVLHLAQTDELAVASTEGRLAEVDHGWHAVLAEGGSVDDAAAAAVATQRGAPPTQLLTRWRAAAAAERAAFTSCAPNARFSWVAGPLSARTLATTRLAECWIHTGDIAEPLGVRLAPDDRLWHIVRLAWRTLPYAFARAGTELTGPVALRLVAPHGEEWSFGEATATTFVRGDAVEFCLLAARRVAPGDTGLRAEGPDSHTVLALVRTYA
jgi:uncharacterized protein (TIGR03084 family)